MHAVPCVQKKLCMEKSNTGKRRFGLFLDPKKLLGPDLEHIIHSQTRDEMVEFNQNKVLCRLETSKMWEILAFILSKNQEMKTNPR